MSTAGKTFSESWHRVANLKVSLRPTVIIRKQFFRGERWYVLHDPFSNQFFRLRPEAYDFVSRLSQQQTVEEVWNGCLERSPDGAPGQEDVIQLLTQLYFANLLYYDLPPDSTKFFERYQKRRRREIRARLMSIMFVRIPLFDPERLLKRLLPYIKLFISSLGALLWVLAVGLAVKLLVDNWAMAKEQVEGILSPGNLPLLYAGLVLIKTLHEFGHAFVCKRYGGEVHTMGVMLLVFTPLPYMDATSSWAFRNRWQRVFVGSAGMITEIFFAAIAAVIWARTGPGTLHSLAYNMMFIASVSTVLFNANPLLRFDGYYILSDLLDIPNLSSRAFKQLRHLVERYLFGYRESTSPAQTAREAAWMTVFGILSGMYRFVVFTGIILFVADKFLLAGLIMAAICVVSWGIVPFFKLINYLTSSPRLVKTRLRAVAVTLGIFLVVLSVLGIIPFPNRFRAPGILESKEYLQVVNESAGYVTKVLSPSGTRVQAGMPLMALSDRELELEMTATRAQLAETSVLEQRARSLAAADLEPIRKRKLTIESKLQDLKLQQEALTVRARQPGIWVAPRISELIGAWLPRGTTLGEIVDDQSFRFSAVVSQDEAANLFGDRIRKAEVRLFAHAGVNLKVTDFQMIPFQQERLPSAALGWLAGGEVPVSVSDETGLQTAEPFFAIFANLQPDPRVVLLHGRSGKIRFNLSAEPLLKQWIRALRQLLQKRYRI